MIPIKAARGRAPEGAGDLQEISMTITPFLALVLAGYAAFMLVLGAVWARSYVDGLRAKR